MNPIRRLFLTAPLFAISFGFCAEPTSMLNIPINDIDGQATTLGALKAKALLIVNVASQCGYTSQYSGLEALWKKYKDKGLVVVGIPSNDFGGQEPGSAAEIKTFCSTSYSVTFPLMEKVAITSGTPHPLYAALTSKAGAVGWNFTKFLVSKDGTEAQKFEPDVEPESEALAAAIEAALK
jgi:glutathione peroxidase